MGHSRAGQGQETSLGSRKASAWAGPKWGPPGHKRLFLLHISGLKEKDSSLLDLPEFQRQVQTVMRYRSKEMQKQRKGTQGTIVQLWGGSDSSPSFYCNFQKSLFRFIKANV